MGRELGGVGTKVVFEDDRVRVWVLKLAPGERSPTHQHDLDHLLIQVRGDRIAVDPEPDTQSPYRDYMEADVIPGMVTFVPAGGVETAVNCGGDPYYEVIVELKNPGGASAATGGSEALKPTQNPGGASAATGGSEAPKPTQNP